jgi:hypothetical protein
MNNPLASPAPGGTISYFGQLARVPLLTRAEEIAKRIEASEHEVLAALGDSTAERGQGAGDPETCGPATGIVLGREGWAVTKEGDEESIRITQQFRARDAIVYDLRGSAGRLTLRITGRGGGDGPPDEWRIEASTSTFPDGVVAAELGATQAEALRAVGRSWDEKRLASNLPHFDWESIARAMAAVRHLGKVGHEERDRLGRDPRRATQGDRGRASRREDDDQRSAPPCLHNLRAHEHLGKFEVLIRGEDD